MRNNVQLTPLSGSLSNNQAARNASLPPRGSLEEEPLHPISNIPSKPNKLMPMDHDKHKANLSAVVDNDDLGGSSGSAIVSKMASPVPKRGRKLEPITKNK